MTYLNAKAVKRKLKEYDRQIGIEGLHALDLKIEAFLDRVGRQFNGHKKRIDAGVINFIKL